MTERKESGYLFYSNLYRDEFSRANPYSYCDPNTLAWNNYLKWIYTPEKKLWQKIVDFKINLKPEPNPSLPKPYQTAYGWFCHDERKKMERDPKCHPKINKELSSRWKNASRKIKTKYKQKAKKDKVRYEKEKTKMASQSDSVMGDKIRRKVNNENGDICSSNSGSQSSLDIFSKYPWSEESLSDTVSVRNARCRSRFFENDEDDSEEEYFVPSKESFYEMITSELDY